jgi:hypothetical protein
MSVAEPIEQAPAVPRRFQASLLDLIVWVLSAGIVAGVVRVAWEHSAGIPPGPLPIYVVVGVVLIGPATWLGLRLLGQVIRLLTGRTGAPAGPGRLGAVAWRVLAAALLLGYVTLETADLRGSFGSDPRWYARWDHEAEARTKVFALSGLFLLAGLILGLTPTARPATPARGRWRGWSWIIVSIPVVLLFALAMIPIAYLVLLALEAVSNAQMHVLISRPGVWVRLGRAVPAAALAAVACLGAGVWLSRELRRMPEPGGQSRRAWPFLLAAAATTIAGAYLLFATIPMLHEWLAAGIWTMIKAPVGAALLVGFAALAAGLAARAVVGREGPDLDEPGAAGGAMPRAIRWLGRAALFLARLVLVALAVMMFLEDSFSPFSRGLDWLPAPWSEHVAEARAWIKGLPHADVWLYAFHPEPLFLELGLIWVAIQVAGLLSARGPAPFDLILARPKAVPRFLGAWAALTALCLAALPTLFVGGIVAFHYLLRP